MNIAICDDSIDELTNISNYIDDYRNQSSCYIKYYIFNNADQLLSSMSHTEYDIIFLDIVMPGISGMEAARQIRQSNPKVCIAFLTSSPEYAVESYEVKAFTYLLKPVAKDKIVNVLDELCSKQEPTYDDFAIRTDGGASRILFSELEFVEVQGKKLYFHLADASIRVTAATLTEYEQLLLNRTEFIKVHRSYIVNLRCIKELSGYSFISYSGLLIPISRPAFPKVRDMYIKSLFWKKEVN